MMISCLEIFPNITKLAKFRPSQDIPFRVSTLPSQNPGDIFETQTLATDAILEKYLVFRSVLNSRVTRDIFHFFFCFTFCLNYVAFRALVGAQLALQGSGKDNLQNTSETRIKS